MCEVETINITAAIENKIDRSKWAKWKFSDLVENEVEKVVPKDSGLKHYIGLEHLDSGSLKIRRFGETSSLIGDKLKIYKGDLIFAKRNAYLKRVAIAEFDAVASAHSMVLRPKLKNVDPNFLPFFMMSEVFWKRAIEISVGSLSPTINWKALAKQEFLLPPKDQQDKLAELLWAMDEVIEREKEVLARLLTHKKVFREEAIITQNSIWVDLETICEKKISYGIVQAGPHFEKGMPYIKSSDLSEEGIDIMNLQRTSREIAEKYKRSEVMPGDIVFSLRGNLGEMNIVPLELTVANLTQGTARLNVKKEFNPNYIKHALETTKVQSRIQSLSKGTTFKEISLEALRTVKIPIPINKQVQKNISLFLDLNEESIKRAKYKINSSLALIKSLINQIF